ncbi:uncharacterized protein LOC122295943 isoform X3 [Carya illinoinensis]|uniref:uncharacterized protein LOC122295943 isoform X3 n=1 Tax=Carya illinoinensis TaxID=32201 RepID=UPI001C71C1B1|nr:uncharacterized protein LOC122295943 isoform X3 [Carya illinoinensis]
MGKEEDGRPPRPSTSTSTTHYVAMPPFGPNMASSMVSNPKELGRAEDTNQYVPMRPFGPMMPSPPSSNPEEVSRGEHTMQYVAMPPPFAMPPFVPSLPSPSSTNLEEFSRGEGQTTQFLEMGRFLIRINCQQFVQILSIEVFSVELNAT